MLQERIVSRVVCDVVIGVESRQEGGMAASWRDRFCWTVGFQEGTIFFLIGYFL